MLLIRPQMREDHEAIQQLHKAQGLDYPLPSDCLIGGVVEDDGKIKVAVLLRKTAEAYMLLDPRYGTRKEKLGYVLALDKEMRGPAKRAGFTDVHCWLPPEMVGTKEKPSNFESLLFKMGWKKQQWQPYRIEL